MPIEEDPFIRYIKCVGTGVKHNRDLTAEEMADAMERMLNRQAAPEQIAAFLLGWRLKPESDEEFASALAVLDRYTRHTPIAESLELGYPFDGKNDEPYLFPLVASRLEPLKIRLVVYGDERQPSKGGLTVKALHRAITPPANLHYFDRRDYAPALAALTPIRRKLGLRTGLNTLERLPNVARATCALIGVFHKPYVAKYVELFAPRYERLAILKGSEGTPEIFGKCRLWLCRNGECEELRIDPSRYGIQITKNFTRRPHDELLAMTLDPDEHLIDLARFNAAVYAFVYGKVGSIDEGWERIGG